MPGQFILRVVSLLSSLTVYPYATSSLLTDKIPLLSMQPAFCGRQFHTNYVWLAKAHLACLGMPPRGCGGGACGFLEINGQRLNVTNFNDNNYDVCGACEGCPIVFVGFAAAIPDAADAFEGKEAEVAYIPPDGSSSGGSSAETPECPPLPPPWKTLPGLQIDPGCSPSESRGSLGTAAHAAECHAKARANGDVNYAVWRGGTNGSCDACAFRWRGPAEAWKYSELTGATSFSWFRALPAPKPSGPCATCPPNPRGGVTSSTGFTLTNEIIEARFGLRGIETVASAANGGLSVAVGNDAFAIGLDGENCTCSSSLAPPSITQGNATISYAFVSPSQQLKVDVRYELPAGARFVSKTMSLTDTADSGSPPVGRVRMINAVSAMDGLTLTRRSAAPSDSRTASNVLFLRWPDPPFGALNSRRTQGKGQPARSSGAFITAQNQFVQPAPSVGWVLDQNWTVSNGPHVLDSAILGLYESVRT